jgi:hypothetical protein
LFDRLSKERPQPANKAQEPSPAQRLLDFVQRWDKDTICSVDILQFGPRCTRKRKDADSATEILEKYGWLERLETNQSNHRRWRIARKALIHPSIAE